jgi:hypothetical protein
MTNHQANAKLFLNNAFICVPSHILYMNLVYAVWLVIARWWPMFLLSDDGTTRFAFSYYQFFDCSLYSKSYRIPADGSTAALCFAVNYR